MVHYETEEVRVGTLKLLSERISEQREEIDDLHGIVRMLRCRLARDVYNAPEARDIRPENGQTGLEAETEGHRKAKEKNTQERLASLTWG